MEINIIKANYLRDYIIEFEFNDKTKQVVDFKDFLDNAKHPDIKKYLDKNLFKTFSIIDGDIDWGDFDLTFPIWDIYTNNIVKNKSQEAS